ncbi:hypothetical protein SS05631_b59290 (plasmid) [Sinorhizobium sp. CCBAU 05631]|nr:hypothetical protein SS05631_b59290 [Sinorhizobium sp. CCBAU 05631]
MVADMPFSYGFSVDGSRDRARLRLRHQAMRLIARLFR